MPPSSASSSAPASHDDDDWDDWASDRSAAGAGDDEATSLFDATTLPSVPASLARDAAEHGFDLIAFRKQVRVREGGKGVLRKARGRAEADALPSSPWTTTTHFA